MDTQSERIYATNTYHVQYAGYDSSRLVVRLDDDGQPIEVMFLIGPCLHDVERSVAAAALSCQLISTALTHGTPLKALAAAAIKPLPVKIAVTRLYGQTPAPVANSLIEWILRHLALTYLTEDDCAEIGVHKGFWCPACGNAETRRVGQSFYCNCGWGYIN